MAIARRGRRPKLSPEAAEGLRILCGQVNERGGVGPMGWLPSFNGADPEQVSSNVQLARKYLTKLCRWAGCPDNCKACRGFGKRYKPGAGGTREWCPACKGTGVAS